MPRNFDAINVAYNNDRTFIEGRNNFTIGRDLPTMNMEENNQNQGLFFENSQGVITKIILPPLDISGKTLQQVIEDITPLLLEKIKTVFKITDDTIAKSIFEKIKKMHFQVSLNYIPDYCTKNFPSFTNFLLFENPHYPFMFMRTGEKLILSYDADTGTVKYHIIATSSFKKSGSEEQEEININLGKADYTISAKSDGTYEFILDEKGTESEALKAFLASTPGDTAAEYAFLKDSALEKQKLDPNWRASPEYLTLLCKHAAEHNLALALSGLEGDIDTNYFYHDLKILLSNENPNKKLSLTNIALLKMVKKYFNITDSTLSLFEAKLLSKETANPSTPVSARTQGETQSNVEEPRENEAFSSIKTKTNIQLTDDENKILTNHFIEHVKSRTQGDEEGTQTNAQAGRALKQKESGFSLFMQDFRGSYRDFTGNTSFKANGKPFYGYLKDLSIERIKNADNFKLLRAKDKNVDVKLIFDLCDDETLGTLYKQYQQLSPDDKIAKYANDSFKTSEEFKVYHLRKVINKLAVNPKTEEFVHGLISDWLNAPLALLKPWYENWNQNFATPSLYVVPPTVNNPLMHKILTVNQKLTLNYGPDVETNFVVEDGKIVLKARTQFSMQHMDKDSTFAASLGIADFTCTMGDNGKEGIDGFAIIKTAVDKPLMKRLIGLGNPLKNEEEIDQVILDANKERILASKESNQEKFDEYANLSEKLGIDLDLRHFSLNDVSLKGVDLTGVVIDSKTDFSEAQEINKAVIDSTVPFTFKMENGLEVNLDSTAYLKEYKKAVGQYSKEVRFAVDRDYLYPTDPINGIPTGNRAFNLLLNVGKTKKSSAQQGVKELKDVDDDSTKMLLADGTTTAKSEHDRSSATENKIASPARRQALYNIIKAQIAPELNNPNISAEDKLTLVQSLIDNANELTIKFNLSDLNLSNVDLNKIMRLPDATTPLENGMNVSANTETIINAVQGADLTDANFNFTISYHHNGHTISVNTTHTALFKKLNELYPKAKKFANYFDAAAYAAKNPHGDTAKSLRQIRFGLLKKHFDGKKATPLTQKDIALLIDTARGNKIVLELTGFRLSGDLTKLDLSKVILTDCTFSDGVKITGEQVGQFAKQKIVDFSNTTIIGAIPKIVTQEKTLQFNNADLQNATFVDFATYESIKQTGLTGAELNSEQKRQIRAGARTAFLSVKDDVPLPAVVPPVTTTPAPREEEASRTKKNMSPIVGLIVKYNPDVPNDKATNFFNYDRSGQDKIKERTAIFTTILTNKKWDISKYVVIDLQVKPLEKTPEKNELNVIGCVDNDNFMSQIMTALASGKTLIIAEQKALGTGRVGGSTEPAFGEPEALSKKTLSKFAPLITFCKWLESKGGVDTLRGMSEENRNKLIDDACNEKITQYRFNLFPTKVPSPLAQLYQDSPEFQSVIGAFKKALNPSELGVTATELLDEKRRKEEKAREEAIQGAGIG